MRTKFLILGIFLLSPILASAKPINLTTDLQSTARAVKHWVETDYQAKTCTQSMRSDFYEPLYEYLYTGQAKPRYSQQQLTGLNGHDSNNSLVTLFEARQLLRDKFRRMVVQGQFSSRDEFLNCANHTRVAMRTIRSWEEQFALYWAKQNGQNVDKKEKTDLSRYDLAWPSWMVHPDYRARFKGLESIQNGDLLLSRGDAFTSGVISRIGAIDNQFSHIAIVYVDDGELMGQKGKKYVVESVLNAGLQILPLEEYMTHTKARWVIFRLKNVKSEEATNEQTVMSVASRWLAQKAKTEKVCYNFTMDLHDPKCMFCSQAISAALDYACKSPNVKCEAFPSYQNPALLSFPLAYTSYKPEQNPLMHLLNMSVSETFAPADVEVDPRLDFVAEYRNLAYTESARMYDMIFTKMFQWMESGQYTFADSAVILAFTKIGDEYVKQMGRMPENTPEGFTQGSMLLYFLVEHLGPGAQWADMLQHLDHGRIQQGLDTLVQNKIITPEKAQEIMRNKDLIAKRIARHVGFKAHLMRFAERYEKVVGQPLPEYDMDKALEAIRIEDCARVRADQEPLFHDLFSVKFDGSLESRCPLQPFKWSQLF